MLGSNSIRFTDIKNKVNVISPMRIKLRLFCLKCIFADLARNVLIISNQSNWCPIAESTGHSKFRAPNQKLNTLFDNGSRTVNRELNTHLARPKFADIMLNIMEFSYEEVSKCLVINPFEQHSDMRKLKEIE